MKTTLLFSTALLTMLAAATTAFAQVKIGDNPTTIKSSAILEIESTNKALFPPRVALTSADVAAPVTGLTGADAGATVYNTANAGTGSGKVTEGICTWNGAKWICINNVEQTVVTAFSANKGNAQTIPANAITKVTYVSENYDRGNNYNTGSSTFTVATSGIYQITACASFNAGAINGPVTGRSIRLFKNGAQINGGLVSANMESGQGYGGCGSTNLLLNAGDYLELAAHVGTTALTISDATFEALKVSN